MHIKHTRYVKSLNSLHFSHVLDVLLLDILKL